MRTFMRLAIPAFAAALVLQASASLAGALESSAAFEADRLPRRGIERPSLPSTPATSSARQFLQSEFDFPGGDLPGGLPQVRGEGCGNVVGILGFGFLEFEPFLAANTGGVVNLTAAGIIAGDLALVDVLFVVRAGKGDAQTAAATIDAWVRGGGVMATEFSATQVFYEPGPLNYFSGALVNGFHVPSGTVCGGNTIVVNEPGSGLAEGLPLSWSCSGDPIGVLQVFDGIDPNLCVIVSVFGSDADGDTIDDPVVGISEIDDGVVIPFFSDFGDFQALEDPRTCPGGPGSASCQRSKEDETLLLNAVCRTTACLAGGGCDTCEGLYATIAGLDIDNEGVRNSFQKKAEAACKALGKGHLHAAGNILCAILNECVAQSGKHLSEESAAILHECVITFAEANGIPLGVPAGHCGGLFGSGRR